VHELDVGEVVKVALVAHDEEAGGKTGERRGTTAAADGTLNPLQAAFHDRHALQCGYCTPGILMTFTDYLGRNPDPSEAEIRDVLSGHLCRCTGYEGLIQAVLDAARHLREASPT